MQPTVYAAYGPREDPQYATSPTCPPETWGMFGTISRSTSVLDCIGKELGYVSYVACDTVGYGVFFAEVKVPRCAVNIFLIPVQKRLLRTSYIVLYAAGCDDS